jgi:cytochrome c2
LIATGISFALFREGFSKRYATEHNSHLKRKASIPAILFLLAMILAACGKDPDLQTDTELGLNPQQVHGRHVFKTHCSVCHSAYSSKGMKGPGLKGLFSRQYLPSGLIANDNFVEQSIVGGRNMMPRTSLTQQQLDDLVAYLHSL